MTPPKCNLLLILFLLDMLLRDSCSDDQGSTITLCTSKIGNRSLLILFIGHGDEAKATGTTIGAVDDTGRGDGVLTKDVLEVLVDGIEGQVPNVDDGGGGWTGGAGTTAEATTAETTVPTSLPTGFTSGTLRTGQHSLDIDITTINFGVLQCVNGLQDIPLLIKGDESKSLGTWSTEDDLGDGPNVKRRYIRHAFGNGWMECVGLCNQIDVCIIRNTKWQCICVSQGLDHKHRPNEDHHVAQGHTEESGGIMIVLHFADFLTQILQFALLGLVGKVSHEDHLGGVLLGLFGFGGGGSGCGTGGGFWGYCRKFW